MSNTRTFANVQTALNDRMRDSQFSSDNTALIKRVFNDVLSKINRSEVGDPQKREVGFDFQRETEDVPFDHSVSGTITTAGDTTLIDSAATFVTNAVAPDDRVQNTTDGSIARVVSVDSETQLTVTTLRNGTDNDFDVDDAYSIDGLGYTINTSWNMKFPIYLTAGENEDVVFDQTTPEYFRRKDRRGSGEPMFSIEWAKNNEIIKVNWSTTEVLYLTFFSNNMVKTSAGVRSEAVANDTDILLIPDRFFLVPIELAAAELYGIKNGYESAEHLRFLESGNMKLEQMINIIGTLRPRPKRSGLRVKSEWGLSSRSRRRER